MRVHFIAIGGSAMHNLALAMHKKGYVVSGSDDEIAEPSYSRLKNAGILPESIGWFPEKISAQLDAVILGMHAREDNPELQEAKNKGVKIFSYPEYIYEQTKNKIRVVIGGSHGKTTITAMILHVLHANNINCDYMVGAQLKGFDTMVKLSEEAKIAVIEGDEYLSSPIDRRPKFHLYHPDIALLSGIAWDHINVFPTFENYVDQFKIFTDLISENGSLIYCNADKIVEKVALNARKDIKKLPYHVPEHVNENGITSLLVENTKIPIKVFGHHNLMNLLGAKLVCNELGISDPQFYNAIKNFEGAAKRLEVVFQNNNSVLFKDFAHSPSKLKATTAAVKNQFPNRKLTACMELHTFSSLNENFLLEYKDAMKEADNAIIYFNPHTIAHKKLKEITKEQIIHAFGNGKNLQVFTDIDLLKNFLYQLDISNQNILMMSSGTFDGLDFKGLAENLYK
ncbi:MAG TPA: Mur ligase family protein [Bacteroidia bacterium]|nr:Mur ligase family protein [Bacteroidia bacterium]